MKKQLRPSTTLFLLMSVDGKISTGANDKLDFDTDLPKIKGLKKGLGQYYKLEQQTDLFSLNTGRVMAKIGVNEKNKEPTKSPCTFIIIDNKPHLKKSGVDYLLKWAKDLILVTTNKKHPALALKQDNLKVVYYNKSIDFEDLFFKLFNEFGSKKVTIQSGGTLNAELLRGGFIDYLNLVIAPALIGGNKTATIIDGESLQSVKELSKIKTLELKKVKKLDNSFIQLIYKVN